FSLFFSSSFLFLNPSHIHLKACSSTFCRGFRVESPSLSIFSSSLIVPSLSSYGLLVHFSPSRRRVQEARQSYEPSQGYH
uniref:Uncharacterized protein n=1 Tax=Cucumis melo TaxID=3656 RepID=A0A9I9E4N3_CUCME